MRFRTVGGVALVTAFVTMTLAAGAAGAQAGLKIAVIDVQRILEDSVQGKAIIANLQQLRAQKAEELEKKNQELVDMRKRYDETRLTLADDKIAEMEKEIEDLAIALRRAQDDAQRELQKKQQEEFGQIEKQIMPIINAVGQEFGYSLIFNKFQSGLVFADESIDVTNLVIERFNAASASGN